MNRKLTSVAVCSVLALALAACGDDTGSGEGGSERANQMYTWVSNASDREQWESFIEGAREYEDPDFELSLEGPSFQEYWTLVRTRMSASDAPCILTTQGARAQELAEILTPLDDLAAEAGLDISEYNDGMIQGLTVDGSVRAIPYDAQPMLLFFNKTMFEEAGLEIPGANYTTDQFLSDAQALTGDGVYGFALDSGFAHPYLTYAFANGNPPVVDGELRLTDPGFVDSVQWAFDLVHAEGVAAAPNPADTDEASRSKFHAGQAAMIIDGPWFYSTILDGADFEVGIAAPFSDSGDSIGLIQGSAFGIAESCPDKEAAFENIVKMTTADVLGYVGEKRGVVPSLEAAMGSWAEGKPEADVAVMEALVAGGAALETTTTWNQVNTQFAQYASEGTRGTRTAEDILSEIQAAAGN